MSGKENAASDDAVNIDGPAASNEEGELSRQSSHVSALGAYDDMGVN